MLKEKLYDISGLPWKWPCIHKLLGLLRINISLQKILQIEGENIRWSLNVKWCSPSSISFDHPFIGIDDNKNYHLTQVVLLIDWLATVRYIFEEENIYCPPFSAFIVFIIELNKFHDIQLTQQQQQKER